MSQTNFGKLIQQISGKVFPGKLIHFPRKLVYFQGKLIHFTGNSLIGNGTLFLEISLSLTQKIEILEK